MSSSQTDPLDPITFMNITRRKSEDSKLSACKTVSYRTALEYSVAVMADSLFEAAAMALRVFSTHGCPTRPAVRLGVQVTPPAVTHIVTVQKVEDCLKGGVRSPREALFKKRLRGSN